MTSPSQDELFGFLAALGAVLGLALLVITIVKAFRPQPPLSVVYATKRELEGVDEKVEKLAESLDKRSEASNASRRQLHEKLNALSNQVAAVDAHYQDSEKHLHTMDRKIDRLIERVSKSE